MNNVLANLIPESSDALNNDDIEFNLDGDDFGVGGSNTGVKDSDKQKKVDKFP
jgi:hypothetical protein